MNFFTICSNNYLANAIVLGEQLGTIYPDAEFTVFLADKCTGYEPSALPVTIVPMDDIGLTDQLGMIKRYNISELNTAIKPFCFSYLMRSGSDAVVYLDPDTFPVSRFTEVEERFRDGADAVLTPHILRPIEIGDFTDAEFLKLGVYNLGFLALRRTHDTEAFLRWWGRRLEVDCVIDLPRGMFVDQKWADLLPCFVAETRILRHPGYNVAYWNLHNRRVTRAGDTLLVSGEPLRFAHFSGMPSDPEDPHVSRHYRYFQSGNAGAYTELQQHYRDRLDRAGHQYYKTLDYSFFLQPGGVINLHSGSGTEHDSDRVLRSENSYLECRQIFSLEHYRTILTRDRARYDAQRDFELGLAQEGGEVIESVGYDFVADGPATFRSNLDYAYERGPDGSLIPNWREHTTSSRSGWPNRIRAIPHVFLQEFQPRFDSDIYLTEQVTALFSWFDERFESVTGSELLDPSERLGEVIGNVRNETVEALTFDDNSFDYVLSFDVFEHVVDYDKSFAEVLRCLKPGGRFFFSIPTNHMENYEHEVRAYVDDDGALVHLMEPEYHGNPVDDDGALCYRYYGWKLLDEMRDFGYQNPYVLEYWSSDFGYLGPKQMFFVGEKPPER